MNPNLFKSAEFYRRRYHNFATLLILPLVLFVAFITMFSLFATKEVTINSKGEITPTQVIASIQSTSNNAIIKNQLVNNQPIKKGDLLIQYSETMETSQKKALETQLASLERQKNGLETLKSSLTQGTNLFTEEDEFGYSNTFTNFITQSKDIGLGISKINTEVSNQATLANNTAEAIDRQMNNLKQQITEYDELAQAITNQQTSLPTGNPHQATLNSYLAQAQQGQGTAVANQYLSQIQQSISGLESSLSSLNIQRAGTGSVASYDTSADTKIEALRSQFLQTASQQLTTIGNQVTELKAQLEQANDRLTNDKITAPETGIIHLNPEFEGKNLVPAGSDIAQIYPQISQTKEVLITYYVTSDYTSLLQKGQEVRLSLEKIGKKAVTITGHIQSIDQTATKTEQGNLFKVTALAQVSDHIAPHIQYGLEGRVTSIIAKKSYFEYYKDKILSPHD